MRSTAVGMDGRIDRSELCGPIWATFTVCLRLENSHEARRVQRPGQSYERELAGPMESHTDADFLDLARIANDYF
jgi:hypothetical protein